MRLRSPGLLARIALALCAVGFLPLILVALQLIGLTTEAQRNTVWGAQVKAATAAASHVNEYLYQRSGLAAFTAADRTLLEDPASPAAAEAIRGTLESFPDLEVLALVSPERELVVHGARDGGEPLLDTALRRPATDLEIFDGGRHVRFEAEAEGTGGARALLIFNAGSILDALDPSGLEGEAELALVEGRRVLVGPDLLSEFESDQLEGALRMQQTLRLGTDLAATVPLGQRQWFVVSRQPTREALRVLGDMRRRATLALLLSSVLIVGLATGAFRSIVRPIRELNRVQAELTGVDPGQRAGNELEQLQDAFLTLERRVREKQALEETFLGRYQVLDVLGEGAMGMVFRGWDPRLERPVALKTLRLDKDVPANEREKLAERLVQEAKTVARFTDPHIVSVFDVQRAGDMAFIAMELIEGVSLDQYLRMHGPRPEAECARLGAAVAKALAAAHEHGVIHQDIKPGNVLLSPEGKIKVVDFGVASLVTALTAEEDIVFGTPGYMPPEALDGEGFGEQGDLFSLGAVLYQCATGTAPFLGRGLSETIRKTYRGTEDLEPLDRASDEISADFAALVFRVLAKDPADRPASALLLAAELEDFAPRDGILWRPNFRSVGPGELETHERPKSRLLPSTVIDRLADRG